MDLAGLTSCRDLGPEHAEEAVRSLDTLRLLVARLTEIADPEDGAPKVLILFARLARGDVPWLEGDVTVEITGNETRTLLDVFKEEGWGIKERLFAQARFRVPFDEFERAVEISAKRFAPLKVAMKPNKIILSSAPDPAASLKPPPVEVELADQTSEASAPVLGFPQEPEPFVLPPAAEPEPFDAFTAGGAATAPEPEPESERGFGAFIDTNEIDDPLFAAAIVSPQKAVPEPPPPRPVGPAAIPMPEPDLTASTVTPKAPATAPGPAKPKADPVHSRPTVRRMVAIKPEALRTGRKDPRREEDD